MLRIFTALYLFPALVLGQDRIPGKATFIEDQTWYQAREILRDTTIVVLPLGAAAKEHGPHLLLKNDLLIAEYLKRRIAAEPEDIYPTINYHYYPAFLEYAGSTSLQFETAVDVVADICRVISAHGPKRFYVLNTGVSTINPLRVAAEKLAAEGILLRFTDILNIAKEAEQKVRQQPEGTHADEIETSMMLYMAPETVDMSKAARDIPPDRKPGPLHPYPTAHGNYSATGIYGDATLASIEKGRIVVEAMVAGIRKEIHELRKTQPPGKPVLPDPTAFTGVYQGQTERFEIRQAESGLVLTQKGQPDRPLLYLSPNRFLVGLSGRLTLATNPDGLYCGYLVISGNEYLITRTSK